MLDHLAILTIGIGHASFLVLAINVLHGLNLRCRAIETAARCTVLALACAPVIAYVGVATLPLSEWPEPIRGYAVACLLMAFVLVPGTTFLRAFRKAPSGVFGRAVEVDLAHRAGAESLIGGGGGAWLLRIPGNESLRVRCEDWCVAVPGLPASLDGLSLVHLTDLHFSPCYDRRFFESVTDLAARWEADLVLFTGDLLDHNDCLGWIEPIFSRFNGRLGKFAVLGNHDYRQKVPSIRRELERGGFTDIDGRWVRLEVEDTGITLGGTSSPWGPTLDLPSMPSSDFRLLLSHSPDLFYRASSWEIDLMLSGHNHGGQIRLPVLGPILMPSRYSRRFDEGFFRHGRTLLYVSRGVGGEQPVRYGSPPEITRFVLRAANRPKADSGRTSQTMGSSMSVHAAGRVPFMSRAENRR
jgi:predicted MPP superfamily phosphohydrolase